MDVFKNVSFTITLTEDEAKSFSKWYRQTDVAWGEIAGEINYRISDIIDADGDSK